MSNERPNPDKVPPIAWFLAQLDWEGDNAGSDHNDGDAVQGYFGWSAHEVTGSASGHHVRYEITAWWEPGNDKRHERSFTMIERYSGTVKAP